MSALWRAQGRRLGSVPDVHGVDLLGRRDLVYRSVEEIPPGLRTKLLKSTSGGNSGTILIADRRGRQEIAKAMGKLPDAAPGQLVKAILGGQDGSSRAEWLTRGQKRGMAAVVVLLALALVAWVFSHHWR